MSADGTLDPSRYTRQQLIGALGRMDRYKYPLNYAILSEELASRPATEVELADSADPRPQPIRSAVTLIWVAAAIQALRVCAMLALVKPLTVQLAVVNSALLGLMIYQGQSLRAGQQWVRTSLIYVLILGGLEVAQTWKQEAWYTGAGAGINLFFDLGRLMPIVLAVVHLYLPESSLWLTQEAKKEEERKGTARDA